MIPEHPHVSDYQGFLEWINTVLDHRHGNLRRLEGFVVMVENWTTDDLKKVKKMNHNLEPRRPHEPVVVLRGLSKDYLLDGNRRINTWIKEQSMELHPVWLVCPVY